VDGRSIKRTWSGFVRRSWPRSHRSALAWTDALGRPKLISARVGRLRLNRAGLIALPALSRGNGNGPGLVQAPGCWPEPVTVTGSVGQLRGVRLEAVREQRAEQLSATRLTDIADREGDSDDLFVEAPCSAQDADWLVRVHHQERLLSDGRKLRAALDAAPVLTEITFERPAVKGRAARRVHQQLKVARPDRTLPAVTVTTLLASASFKAASAPKRCVYYHVRWSGS
jgi:hypothetical protein